MSLNSKPQTKSLICGRYTLTLEKPLLMGILNITPDSFSDGGKFSQFDLAIRHAHRLVEEGADILDVGGESTRPGASVVSEEEELHRVIPLIEKLTSEIEIPISIDTSKAIVMAEAVKAGASMINDVCALRQPEALETASKLNVPVCLMHMQGEPRSMQKSILYDDVVKEVMTFLRERANSCITAGIEASNLIIDPGFGFGKSLEHNIALLKAVSEFVATGFPVLVGLSRKSLLGAITGKPIDQRLAGSLALASIALNSGAQIIRVHDVAETRDLLDVYAALKQQT